MCHVPDVYIVQVQKLNGTASLPHGTGKVLPVLIEISMLTYCILCLYY